MTEIRDRDGDLVTVSPAGGGRWGLHLKTSTPWGVEVSPEQAAELMEALRPYLPNSDRDVRAGGVWTPRHIPGRLVRVLMTDTEGVVFEVIRDSDDVRAGLAARRPGVFTRVGSTQRVKWETWLAAPSRRYVRVEDEDE